MEQEKMKRLRELTGLLNQYRREYYDLNAPTVDDGEYDRLFDELAQLEKELGTQMGNSPTQTVGWPARDGLDKVSHPIPLLSLDKTKLVDELCAFIGEQPVMLMLKLDGLTLKLTYEQGILLEAATRGDGEVGENVTHNVRGISGIPSQIPYKGHLVVTGEAFIRPAGHPGGQQRRPLQKRPQPGRRFRPAAELRGLPGAPGDLHALQRAGRV